jgi:hypothetical protein
MKLDRKLALAAPVELGIMLVPAARPPLQSFFEGPSTVFCVAAHPITCENFLKIDIIVNHNAVDHTTISLRLDILPWVTDLSCSPITYPAL